MENHHPGAGSAAMATALNLEDALCEQMAEQDPFRTPDFG